MSQEETVAEVPPAPWSSPGSGLPPAGYRQTGPRARVWSLIAGLERPFSAEEVVRQARAQAWPVSRATVYRALSLFERLGLIERVHGLGRTHRYVRCAPRHHHHLICAGCGRVEDLPGCPLEELLPALVGDAFLVEGHRLEVFGRCARCWGESDVAHSYS